MSKRAQLGDYPPQRLSGKTFTLGPGHDEDRKGSTVEHTSAGHRAAPLRDGLAVTN
jgi:hypothetical protein